MSTTDDTRQRSIPEILGWEYREVDGYDDWGAWYATVPFDANGQRLIRPHGPTVDNMLSWLREQGYAVDVGESAGDWIILSVRHRSPASTWRDPSPASTWREFPAPTLLDAFEAAVHAVAEVSGDV